MARRYPLESLRLAKQRDKEASVRAASSAAEQRKMAADAASRACAVRVRATEDLRTRMAAEAVRVDAGGARAGDLVRAGQYQEEAERHVRSKELIEERAAELLTAARRTEDAARDDLSRAHGAERSVDEHRARFISAESQGAERRAEDETADLWSAARSRSGKPPGKPPGR